MATTDFKAITVEYATRMCAGSHIGNDILLLDEIAKMPLPKEPRRMESLFLALCLRG